MDRFEQYELSDGTGYRGHTYFLTGFVEPPPDVGEQYDPDVDADAWGVSIARRIVLTDGDGGVVHTDTEEIVRTDTRHGTPHIDYVFMPPGHPDRKEILAGAWPYSKMKQFLEAHWREYVDKADGPR